MLGIIAKLLATGLGYLTHKDDAATAKALEEIRGQFDVMKAREANPVVRFAVGLMAVAAAFYFVAIVIDTIFQLPGDVANLPPSTAALFSVVVGGMFWRGR